MTYTEYTLSPLLKPFVNRIWEFELNVSAGEVIYQPDSCTATTHLIFCLKRCFKTNRNGALLHANPANLITPLTQPVINMLEGDHLNIGVEFTTTGFHRLWQIPIYAITTISTDLHDLQAILGREAHHLYLKLQEANSTTQRFSILENFLLSHIHNKPTKAGLVEAVTQLVYQEPDWFLIHKLTKRLSCSERTLSRHFNEQLGISPKTYLRFQRFLRVRNQLLEYPEWRWQTSIGSVDYYDQAHLINEFVALAGRSPTAYKKTLNDVEAFFSKRFH